MRRLRRAPLGARPAFDEVDDRREHLRRRVEVALVHAQLAAAEAHHHGAVPRQPAALDARQAERAQHARAARRRCAAAASSVERELSCIATAAKQSRQRSKHLTGPGTKVSLVVRPDAASPRRWSSRSMRNAVHRRRPPAARAVRDRARRRDDRSLLRVLDVVHRFLMIVAAQHEVHAHLGERAENRVACS